MDTNRDGRRVQRMEKEVSHAVGNYLQRHFRPSIPVFVSVSRVKMPGDLRSAKIYVRFLFVDQTGEKDANQSLNGTPDKQAIILQELKDFCPDIQRFLAEQLQSRFCPKLNFFTDESFEQVLKVESALQEISRARTGTSAKEVPVTEPTSDEEN